MLVQLVPGQTLGLVQSLLRMEELPWIAPDYSIADKRAWVFGCITAQAAMACICLRTPRVSDVKEASKLFPGKYAIGMKRVVDHAKSIDLMTEAQAK